MLLDLYALFDLFICNKSFSEFFFTISKFSINFLFLFILFSLILLFFVFILFSLNKEKFIFLLLILTKVLILFIFTFLDGLSISLLSFLFLSEFSFSLDKTNSFTLGLNLFSIELFEFTAVVDFVFVFFLFDFFFRDFPQFVEKQQKKEILFFSFFLLSISIFNLIQIKKLKQLLK